MMYEIAKSDFNEFIKTLYGDIEDHYNYAHGPENDSPLNINYRINAYHRAELLIENHYKAYDRERTKFLKQIGELRNIATLNNADHCRFLADFIQNSVLTDIITKEKLDTEDRQRKETNEILRSTAAKYQNDFLELQKSTNGLNAQIEILKEERDEARFLQTKYSKEIETLNETIEQFRRGSVAKSDELHAEQRKVEKLEKKVEKLETEKAELEESNTKHQNKYELQKGYNEFANGQNAELLEEREKFIKTNQELKDHIETLTRNLNLETEGKEELQQSVADQEKEIADYKKQLSTPKEKLTKHVVLDPGLKQRIALLEKQLETRASARDTKVTNILNTVLSFGVLSFANWQVWLLGKYNNWVGAVIEIGIAGTLLLLHWRNIPTYVMTIFAFLSFIIMLILAILALPTT